MDLKHVIARDDAKKTAIMRLYGAIGSEPGQTNGHYFAQELAYLSDNYETIDIRVNCEGGEVVQGFSIFSAILNSKAKVNYIIEGLAASMGGFIAMAADHVAMNDFGRLMIHDPFIPDAKGKLTAKQQAGIDNLGAMLAEMTAKRCGSKEKAAEYMKAETWFTAEEAKAAGFVDEIITTGKALNVAAYLTGIAAISSQSFETFLSQPKTDEQMKVLATFLRLPETAGEPEIMAAVQKLQAEKATAEANATALQATIDTMVAEKNAAIKAEMEVLIDEKITAGFFAPEMKARLVTMGEGNPEGTKAMLNGLQKPAASVTATIAAASASTDTSTEKLDDADKFLAKMKDGTAETLQKENPALFAKLEAAYTEKYC